jgi:hypothetical protein
VSLPQTRDVQIDESTIEQHGENRGADVGTRGAEVGPASVTVEPRWRPWLIRPSQSTLIVGTLTTR